MLLMLLVAGCGQGKTAQEEYDAATAAYAIESNLHDEIATAIEDAETRAMSYAADSISMQSDAETKQRSQDGIQRMKHLLIVYNQRMAVQSQQLKAADNRRQHAWEELIQGSPLP